MTFPQYRKYSNQLSYFKIVSPQQVEEIKVLGKYYQVFVLHAQQLPDRNFIADLLHADGGDIVPITEADFRLDTTLIIQTKELLAG